MKKKTILKAFAVILSLIMLLSIFPVVYVSAETTTNTTDEDFGYEITNGEVTILDYTGSATKLTIPSSIEGCPVTSIGYSAFDECTNLISVIIPDSVESVDGWSFYACTSLTSVTIGKSVTSIGATPFEGCDSLINIIVDENNTSFSSLEGVLFNKDKSELICYPSNKEGTSYSIPNGVKTIREEAFCCKNLIDISIPKSVTFIDDSAFAGCNTLNTIKVNEQNRVYHSKGNCLIETETKVLIAGSNNSVIPDDGSVTSIGDDAFRERDSLSKIIIPSNVVSIGYDAFYGCDSLADISISDATTKIGPAAFKNSGYENDSDNWENGVLYISNHLIDCDSSVQGDYQIRPGTKTIADGAFQYCNNLTSITIPESVISINAYAFSYCNYITNITIPDSVIYIGKSSFEGCINLSNITIQGSSINIGSQAFEGTAYYENPDNWEEGVLYISNHLIEAKDSLQGNYSVKDGTKTIAVWAFDDCSDLTGINIPKSVLRIGDYTFWGCNNLKDVYINDFEAWCNIIFDNEDSNPMCYAENLYLDGEVLTSVVVPENIKSIKNYTFLNCTNLKNITFHKNISDIGDYAFYKCNELQSISIPDGVKNIGDYAFYKCNELQSISIPDSVKNIGDYAFYECSNLSNVSLGGNIVRIGNYAFWNCEKLNDVVFPENLELVGDNAFWGCNSFTYINIPNGVIEIGGGAFGSCESVKEILLGDSLVYIGDHAFIRCKSITEVSVPDKVESIGDFAFQGCDNLKNITLGKSLKEIGEYAFSSCPNIIQIVLPDSVTYIGEHAFWECHNLKYINIPKSVMHIGEGVFSYCVDIEEIDVSPENQYFTAKNGLLLDNEEKILYFYPYKKYLPHNTYNIPEGVTTILSGAVYFQYNTECIYIPTSVTRIESGAFVNFAFDHIVYAGTQAQWEELTKGLFYNVPETVHFNSSNEEIQVEYVPATCKENGYVHINCTLCDYELEETMWRLDHNNILIEKTEPACNKSGYAKYQCEICDEIKEEWISPISHTSGDIVEIIDATCTQDGYTKYQCSVCNEEFIGNWVFAIGHSGEPSNTIAPTCIENGYTEFLCESCGKLYRSDITAPMGHTFENEVCVNCNKAKEDCIESLHNYENDCDETWVINKPNADYITITFSSATELESGYDYIYVYDMNDNLLGQYTGTELASQTVTVTGNIVKIRLVSDGIGTRYGFSVSDIRSYIKLTSNDVDIVMPENVIDSTTELKVDRIDVNNIVTALPEEYDTESANAYDIYFEKDNQRVQLNGEVTVYIPVQSDKNGNNCKVFHIDETGKATDMNAVYEDGDMAFTTDHFSIYVVVESREADSVVLGLLGDANEDGKVNIKDATLIQKSIANLTTLTDNGESLADADLNTKINIKDATAIQKHIAGIETGYPIGKPRTE